MSDGDMNKTIVANEPEDEDQDSSNEHQDESTEEMSNNKKRKRDWFLRKNRDRSNRAKNIPEKKKRSPDNEVRVEQPPHEGSYASPSMQELFGVEIEKLKASCDNEDSDGAASRNTSKRKVAILLAFIGEQYNGFQMNPGTKTIQAQVELALYRAGLLSDTNFGHPHKYSWSSSARTDKGVHACAHVVSVKLEFPNDVSTDDVRIRTNAHLPDDVCVLDVVRTTRKFCARTQRDCVRYQYMFPSFMLYDRQKLRQLMESLGCHENGHSPSDPLSQEEVDALRKELVNFRAPPERVERLREALSNYVGTKLFHNFTSGKTHEDGSSQRYIISFDMQDPVVMKDGTEWIVTQVKGQSFLLHQIRKMVSLAVDVARGATEMTTMDKAFSERAMRLNVAPAQGLFLDMSFFDRYNKQKHTNENLDWSRDTSTPAMDRWKHFKESVVVPHILKEEARDGNFIKYLFLQEYVFNAEKQYLLPRDQTPADETKNEESKTS